MADKKNQYFGKDLEAMSFAKNYHDWIMDELNPFLGQSVAEIGAGIGDFSRLILQANISSLTAYEPSQNMFPELEKTLNEDVRAESINGFFDGECAEKKYDSVIYVNVLEHIEDHKLELENAYKSLNKGGHLLIFVPALPWLYSNLDKQVGHFRRYMKKDLVVLTQQSGFSIVKARYFDVAGIIPWYINFVLLKNAIGGSSVSLYDKIVVPPMRVVERFISPPLGKNVLLVAKKD